MKNPSSTDFFLVETRKRKWVNKRVGDCLSLSQDEREEIDDTRGVFFSVTRFYGKTLKNVKRYVTDSRLGLVVRCVKWDVRVAKQVRLIDSRVGDERQPSTRSHRSRRLRRSTDLLREITRHCTPRQRCIYPDYVTPLNRVYARPSSRFCSTLIEPRTNPSLSRFSFFFFRSGGKETKRRVYSSLSLPRINVPSFPFFLLLPHWKKKRFPRSFSSSSKSKNFRFYTFFSLRQKSLL